MLRRLPLDHLKIDHSFIDGLGVEPGDTQIVRVVLSLAAELGLGPVAEGVETEAQRRELVRLGCDIAQGYLFSPPVPIGRACELLRTGIAVERLAVDQLAGDQLAGVTGVGESVT
jgi:EAL domain-containing protein (putative c-di-GMP-specific phosphodiesterase class I)